MLKIVILSNSLSAGGAERVANLVANNLSAQNFETSLIAVNSSKSDLVQVNCDFYVLGRQSKANLFMNLRVLRDFRKLMLNLSPDVLIVNCEFPELLACFAPKHIRIIAVEHTTLPWSFSPKLGKLIRWILKVRSCEWVTVSPKKEIWPFNQVPIYIPNYYAVKRKLDVNAEPRAISRLVFIGRFSSEKNPSHFLAGCDRTKIPGLMIGTGPLELELKEKATQLTLDIEFAGHQFNPWDFFCSGDLLVVPSKWEGDGLVVVEALDLGLPLLLSDIPDLRRFDLPESNYFSLSDKAVSHTHSLELRIKEFEANIQGLVPPKNIRERLLSDRNPKKITEKWVQFVGQTN
jgi:glycosyltransferase involved in cell wall biosynthesis